VCVSSCNSPHCSMSTATTGRHTPKAKTPSLPTYLLEYMQVQEMSKICFQR
jgi:hypothetical protein